MDSSLLDTAGSAIVTGFNGHKGQKCIFLTNNI